MGTDLEIQTLSDADLLDKARNSLAKGMATLETHLEKVRKKLEGSQEVDDKLGSHLAWATTRLAEVTNALRQLEKHDRHMARSPEQRFRLVLAYLRQLDPIRRAQIRAELDRMQEERSVLQ